MESQHKYWDKVAKEKTFTHPIDIKSFCNFVSPKQSIIDYGCGYGRIINELKKQDFSNIIDIDFSKELIKRAQLSSPDMELIHIKSTKDFSDLKLKTDAIILFAVLTCIPSNKEQKELIKAIYNSLNTEGILYISDYYLQTNSKEVKDYQYINGDKSNYGVFYLQEGVYFRHHTQEWIKKLLQDFEIVQEKNVEVKTMNGHSGEAFQIFARKR